MAHQRRTFSTEGLCPIVRRLAIIRSCGWLTCILGLLPHASPSQVDFTHVNPDPVYDFSPPPLTINRSALPVFFTGIPHYAKLGFDVKTNLAGSDYRDVLVAAVVDKVTPANFVYQDGFGTKWYLPAGANMTATFNDKLLAADPTTGISECPLGHIYITELTLDGVAATNSGGVKATYSFSMQCRVPNPAYANQPPASRPDDFLYLFAANCKLTASFDQSHSIPENGPGSSSVVTPFYFKVASSGGVSYYLPSGDGEYASRVHGADTTFALDSWESDSGTPSPGMARSIQWINRCFSGMSFTRDHAFESAFPGSGFAYFLGDAVFQPFFAFGVTVPKEQVQGGAGGVVSSNIASMNQQAINLGDNAYFVLLNFWAVNYPEPPALGSPASDIQVEILGSNLPDGATHTFPARNLGAAISSTFAIKNMGNASLDPLRVKVIGANPSDFLIAAFPTSPVASGGQTAIQISFAPVAAGSRKATLVIDSNDPDESPFHLQLAGTGVGVEPLPEIVVESPSGTGISSGGSFSFGGITVGVPTTQSFTIRNTGTAILTGITAALDGVDASQFSLPVLPAAQVAVGSSATVSVRCQPTSAGTKSARLRISSNDTDENPFDILLSASASQPTQSIRLMSPSGLTVQNGGSSALGIVPVGSNEQGTFEITNTGTTQISALSASISAAAAGDFSILLSPAATLPPGAVTTCSVRFNPQTIGLREGTFEIRSGTVLLISAKLEGGGTVPGAPTISGGPVYNTGNGHSYYLLGGSTWTAAEAKARAMNGHLVTINDASEQTWVMTEFNATDSLWLGLSDSAIEGSFRWADGDPATYRNWFPGEPNGANPGEDYTIVWAASFGPTYAGLWNDIADVNGHGARGVVELPTSAPDITISTPQVWDIGSGFEVEVPASRIGSPATLDLVLSNHRSSLVGSIKPFLEGSQAQDFAIIGNPPIQIGSGEELPMTIRFTPSQLGPRTALLTVVSDDPDESAFRIPLLGYGVDPLALYNGWTTAWGLAGANAQPNAVPFGDGVPNLLKYAFNLLGDASDRSLLSTYSGLSGLPRITFIPDPDESTCTVEFVRRKRCGLNYVAKKSTTLAPGSFIPLPDAPFVTWEEGEWEHVMVHDNFRLSTTPRAYYVVEVSMP